MLRSSKQIENLRSRGLHAQLISEVLEITTPSVLQSVHEEMARHTISGELEGMSISDVKRLALRVWASRACLHNPPGEPRRRFSVHNVTRLTWKQNEWLACVAYQSLWPFKAMFDDDKPEQVAKHCWHEQIMSGQVSTSLLMSVAEAAGAGVFREWVTHLSLIPYAKRRELVARKFTTMQPADKIREAVRTQNREECLACQKYLNSVQGSCGCDGALDNGCPACGGVCIGTYRGQEPTGEHARDPAS